MYVRMSARTYVQLSSMNECEYLPINPHAETPLYKLPNHRKNGRRRILPEGDVIVAVSPGIGNACDIGMQCLLDLWIIEVEISVI